MVRPSHFIRLTFLVEFLFGALYVVCGQAIWDTYRSIYFYCFQASF